MKKLLLILIVVTFVTNSLGQGKDVSVKNELQELLAEKQLVVYDLEAQFKGIPYATVRSFVRYNLAAWLWKDGKDETEQAEQIAIKAVDELYEHKVEIPDVYFNSLHSKLFTLLDINAKETAKKLREKYKNDTKSGLNNLYDLLDQENGEKLAADRAIQSLSNQSIHGEIIMLISQLQQRKSVHALRLMNAIIQVEETGQVKFIPSHLHLMSSYFTNSVIPTVVQKRFLQIIINRAIVASQTTNTNTDTFLLILNQVLPQISLNFQELLPRAQMIQTILKAKTSNRQLESEERYRRINSSSDKLRAMVSEAENADDKLVKYELFVTASRLALRQKKFIYSVDLAEIAFELDISDNSISETSRNSTFIRALQSVVPKALKAKKIDAAKYAIKKIDVPLIKAETLRHVVKYHLKNKELLQARFRFDQVIKLISKTEDNPNRRIRLLITLIPIAEEIETPLVFEINSHIAKFIKEIPSLDIDDKPKTENYKRYVTKIMIINWNLNTFLKRLIKDNRNAVTDLNDQIKKREIKVVSSMVLLTNSIDRKDELLKEQIKKENSLNQKISSHK